MEHERREKEREKERERERERENERMTDEKDGTELCVCVNEWRIEEKGKDGEGRILGKREMVAGE